jgi:hypothetical protein
MTRGLRTGDPTPASERKQSKGFNAGKARAERANQAGDEANAKAQNKSTSGKLTRRDLRNMRGSKE